MGNTEKCVKDNPNETKSTKKIEKHNIKCKWFNRGYCRMKSQCEFYHSPNVCTEIKNNKECLDKDCRDKHPKDCKNWMKGECKFNAICEYKHDLDKKAINKHDPGKKLVNVFDEVIDDEGVIDNKIHIEYSCDKCESTFKTNSDIIEHVTKVHEKLQDSQTKYTCDECHDTFQTNNELEEHVTTSHKTKNNILKTNDTFSCNYCNEKFTKVSDHENHVSKHDEQILNIESLCHNCDKVNETSKCIDCPKIYCLACVKTINTDKVLKMALAKGILDKKMESNKFICKECFKNRCSRKQEQITARKY